MLGLRKLAILAAVAGMALAATPASATGAGGGVVEGTVNIPGGIPTGACGATSYTFASTALVGAFADSVAGAYVGTINVNANGGSSCENTQGGSGSVNVTCAGGTGVGTNPPGVHAGIQCSLSGGFVRIGPLVIIADDSTGAPTGPAASLRGTCQNVACTVAVPASVFIPTAGNGVTTPVTSAQFAGAFVGQS